MLCHSHKKTIQFTEIILQRQFKNLTIITNIFQICCPPEFLNQDDRFTNTPEYVSGSVDPISLLPSDQVCGIQNNDRIVGGTQADIDEYPWMALVQYNKRKLHHFQS